MCNTRSMTLVCFGVVRSMSAAFTPFSDPATLLRSCISYKPRDAFSVLGSCSAWLCSPASAAPHLLHGLPYRPACLPARCAAPPRPRDSSNLRHPVTLFDSAPRPTRTACHLSPPTRGDGSQSFPAPSCSAETSDFPNSQLPRSAPGLRHNMTAPFAPHAVPAALACTCTPLEPLHVLTRSGMPWPLPGAARPSRVSVGADCTASVTQNYQPPEPAPQA